MKNLIEWAAYAFVAYMALEKGMLWAAGLLFGYLICYFLRWLVSDPPYQRAVSHAEYYGFGVKTPNTTALPQEAQPKQLEKLTSSHKFGRYELTFDFKTYFIYENGKYRKEEKLYERFRQQTKRTKELRRKVEQELLKREIEEFERQRDLVLFAARLKTLNKLNVETKTIGPLDRPDEVFEIIEIPYFGKVYRKV